MQKQIRLTGLVIATTFALLTAIGSGAVASGAREKGGAPWRPILVSRPMGADAASLGAVKLPVGPDAVRIAERPAGVAGVKPADVKHKSVKRRTSSIPRRSMVSSKR